MLSILLLTIIIGFVNGAPIPDDSDSTAKRPSIVIVQLAAPKFLADATPKGREEFAKIVFDKSLTIAQISEKLNEWATAQGPQVKADYEEAREEVKDAISKAREQIEKSSMSDATKEAFLKIGEMLSDKNQTEEQLSKKIKDFVDSLPEDTRKQMEEYVGEAIDKILEKAKAKLVAT